MQQPCVADLVVVNLGWCRKLRRPKGGEATSVCLCFDSPALAAKTSRSSFSQPPHCIFSPTSPPLSSHSSTRFIRDHERQHDPPKGQQACAVSLSLSRRHIPTYHNNTSCLPPSPAADHLSPVFAARHLSTHPSVAAPPQCLPFDPTKQSLTIAVPPKTLLSTRPPSPPAHNSLAFPASKKVCATEFSPSPSLTNDFAQRTLPQYSLPTPPSFP